MTNRAENRYELHLEIDTDFSGAHTEHAPLKDYGYSDEEWDALSKWERTGLLNEWAQELVSKITFRLPSKQVTYGYVEAWGEVRKDG